jgi:hypothetical protein
MKLMDDARQRELQAERLAAEERMKTLANSMRQQPAPTMSEVIDPTNTRQLLKVDARVYKGGGIGSPGVIGVAGKEPTFASKEDKVRSGKEQLSELLDQVETSYTNLQQANAIPSNERNPLSNIGSSIQSSVIGQIAGRTIGTKEQTERDVIKSSRLMILNALKQATGKSAQELNSNVELKTNLDALSDPTQGYETATRIIDNIRKTYLKTPETSGKSVVREVRLKDGRIGVEYSDGTRGFK